MMDGITAITSDPAISDTLDCEGAAGPLEFHRAYLSIPEYCHDIYWFVDIFDHRSNRFRKRPACVNHADRVLQ